MMPIRKRILLIILFYVLNIGFSFVCIWISAKGLLFTVRYEWMNLIRLNAMFLIFSHAEMCMVMHRYHRNRNAFGKECIALDSRCTKQMIELVSFYVTSLIFSFFFSMTDICYYMFALSALIAGMMLMFGSGRFLWIDGEIMYIMNEIGELFQVKDFEKNEGRCTIIYANNKGKEYKVKIKQKKRMKEGLKDIFV